MFCPAGSVAPISVSGGFYTADYSSLLRADSLPALWPCPPGHFRNFSEPLRSQLLWSARNSSGFVGGLRDAPACQLCPDGTYKPAAGDSGCEPCPAHTLSTEARTTCECQWYVNGMAAFFDNGQCSLLDPEGLWGLAEDHLQAALNDSFTGSGALTRFRQLPCEPGFVCEAGVRRKCPAGFFGPRGQESRPQCGGPCSPGFFCPLGSSSPFQLACGGPDRVCPAGSAQPLEVSAGSYSNEDEGSGLLRSSQLPWYTHTLSTGHDTHHTLFTQSPGVLLRGRPAQSLSRRILRSLLRDPEFFLRGTLRAR